MSALRQRGRLGLDGAEARAAGVTGVEREVADGEGRRRRRRRVGGRVSFVLDVRTWRGAVGAKGEARGDGLQLFAYGKGRRRGLGSGHARGRASSCHGLWLGRRGGFGEGVDGDDSAGDLFERHGSGVCLAGEHVDDGAGEAPVVGEELAVVLEIEALVEQSEAGEEEQLVLVQADGKGHAAFLEELDDLDDALARFGESDGRGRRFRAEVGGDDGAVDQCAGIVKGE